MNSFERFACILDGKKPDKMPFYYPTIACTVGSEILGREANTGSDSLAFKEELSWLDGEQAHAEFVQKMHEDTVALYRLLQSDVVRETIRGKAKPTKKLDDNTLLFERSGGGRIVKRFFPETQSYGVLEDTTGKYYDAESLVRHLSREMENSPDIDNDYLEDLYRDALQFKKMADPYFPSIINAFGFGIPMYDPVWLEALVLEPEFLREYFLFRAEQYKRHIPFLKKQGYRFINGGMDLAMQTGPMYSPASFRAVIFDGLKNLNNACREAGLVYCYRSDGNLWALFDMMFSEIGIPAYGEVDRLADMSVKKIRERNPDLVILGNISSATLNLGTEQEVRQEVAASLRESEGFRYIPGPSNAILHKTPLRNIYAMLEEIERFRP